jgi:ABC-type uncharacterized transport system substrate-binding protein
MENKVKEVQEYLHKKGIDVTETSIVNAAIDITRRLGAGDWTFVCEFKEEGKK